MNDQWLLRGTATNPAANPFSPTFGTQPPLLAGRDSVLDRIRDAVGVGPAHPDFTLLVTGPRGSGKTTLLNALDATAKRSSWQCISVSASTAGLCDQITKSALRALRAITRPKTEVKSASLFGVSASWERVTDAADEDDLRFVLTELGARLDADRLGVLVTVDELQGADPLEVRELASVVQHVTRREGHPVLFVFAALPEVEDTLLADSGMTFFHRCARAKLLPLSDAEVTSAIAEPIRERAGRISDDALDLAVRATSGYPFMVQLVGFHSWASSRVPATEITRADVEAGIVHANEALVDQVIRPVWAALSEADQSFLRAMAQDDGPSRISVIADRIERSHSYANVYRSRLIRAGVIRPAGYGYVRFTHRALGDLLRSGAVPTSAHDNQPPLFGHQP